MKTYKKIEVSEQSFEDLVRKYAGMIEDGLVYVDHQKQAAGGRLDVLMVDSGKSLVVAELKIIEDDGMLVQGLDYYDYVSANLETYARIYKHHAIDPKQEVRLLLIAPTFSRTLINRCKWLVPKTSLITYSCLQIDGDEEVIPVFSEQPLSAKPQIVEVSTLQDHLNYIKDDAIRSKASNLLEEIKSWNPDNIVLDPISWAVSIKVNNRVFAYFMPKRKFFTIGTYNADDHWTDYPIQHDDELENVKPIIKQSMERRMKG